MVHRVFYKGFELKPDTTLLLEFDGQGKILYRLTAEGFGFYQDPDRTDDFDITETMGFCIYGNEHGYPQSVREVAPGEADPISVDGLQEIGWDELEEGMAVIIELLSSSVEPLTLLERVIDEEDLEGAELDGQFYPLGITLNEDQEKIYLKESA